MMPAVAAPNAIISTSRTDALARILDSKLTRKGVNLATLSMVSPVLLVFLRHAGCVFCREAMSDLASTRETIEKTGTRIVIVFLGDDRAIDEVLQLYGLSSLDRIHDVDQSLYRAFGLKRGTWRQLAGPRVWWRGMDASFVGGHKQGRTAGDVRQMPGIFLLNQCEVVRSFRHSSAGDRPLYDAFVRTALEQDPPAPENLAI
jgi:peroxiredoxin